MQNTFNASQRLFFFPNRIKDFEKHLFIKHIIIQSIYENIFKLKNEIYVHFNLKLLMHSKYCRMTDIKNS